jgi:hypothetical protein
MAENTERREVEININTNAEQASRGINTLNDSLETTSTRQRQATSNTRNLQQSFEDLPGPIGNTVSGFKSLLKSMWALVANPIGLVLTAIVLALTTLFKAFTSTKAGAEKFDQIMAGISATIDVLRDRVLKVGSAIVKFFSGDFKGAIEDGKAAVTGFGDEVAEEFQKAANATKSLQEVTDAMRELGVERARLDRDLAESERILTDINATYEDKKKALEAVSVAEAKQTEAELANARKKLEAIRALNALSDSSAEALDEEAEAQKRVFELEKKSSEDRRKVSEFNKRLQDEEKARLKTIDDERKARQKEIDEQRKAQFDKDFAFAQQQAELVRKIQAEKLEADRLFREQEQAELDAELEADIARIKKRADEEKAIAEALQTQKEEIKAKEISLAERGVALIAQIFGKSKKVQKAAMIAESATSISKQVAANNAANIGALATPQAIATSGASAVPVIALNNVSTGIGIASTIASTAKALQSLGGGSAPSVSGGGQVQGGGTAPQVSFQASSENQIANATANNINNQQPIQAYVVESEVTTAQSLANNRITANSL